MADVYTAAKRSEIMRLIRPGGNRSTELRMMKLLRVAKIRGWRRGSRLPGKPDFVFSKPRVVLFVDGDFWHGHTKKKLPVNNGEFWLAKVKYNRSHDRAVTKRLRARGWTVIRVWESDLKRVPARVLIRLKRVITIGLSKRAATASPAKADPLADLARNPHRPAIVPFEPLSAVPDAPWSSDQGLL